MLHDGRRWLLRTSVAKDQDLTAQGLRMLCKMHCVDVDNRNVRYPLEMGTYKLRSKIK